MVDSVHYFAVHAQLDCDCHTILDLKTRIVAGQNHRESSSIISPRGLLPLSLVTAIVIVMDTSHVASELRRLTPEVLTALRRQNEDDGRRGHLAHIGVDDVDLLLDAAEAWQASR